MKNNIERAHAPQYLQQFAIGYKPMGMVADIVCPRVPVTKQSDKYRVWGKDVFQERDLKRAPGAPPVQMAIGLSDDQYATDAYAVRVPLLDEELGNADGDVNLRMAYTEAAKIAIAIAREKRVASLYTTAANHKGSHVITKAGGAEWDTLLATQPDRCILDIDLLLGTIADDAVTPISELSLVIPEQVWRKVMRNNAAYLDRIKYTEKGIVTTDLIAAVHGVKEVILASGQSVAGNPKVVGDIVEGYDPQYLWGDNVWAGLIGPSSAQMIPSFARAFNWTVPTAGQSTQVFEYRDADPGTKKSWIEVEENIGEKITARLAGGVIRNALA